MRDDQKVTLVDLREQMGISVDRSNNMQCPFCEGSRKLLHFNDDSDTWRCAKCGAKGGVLDFYSQVHLGIPLPDNKEKRRELKEDMLKFLGRDQPGYRLPPRKKTKAPPKVEAANDGQLHAVYSAMASLAIFHLRSEDERQLLRRGLSKRDIERNGYRSFPFKTQIPKEICDMYHSVPEKPKDPKEASQIQLGLLVAKQLTDRGYQLEGIPGFYKFGPYWCLTYLPGLLIPTRNHMGQIVAWQVRRKYGAKYLTLSCSRKPGAVNGDISRCHFPLGNAKLSPTIRVMFTEGPLKADVACALSTDPCAFIAIPGVQNTKDLLRQCDMLLQSGVTTLYNALDMDKLTNKNVRSGSDNLDAALHEKGMTVTPMYWAEAYAAEQFAFLRLIANAKGLLLPSYDARWSSFDRLRSVSEVLSAHEIDPGKVEGAHQWEPETKGIDDYLMSLHEPPKPREHTARTELVRAYHKKLLEINKDPSN